MRNFRDSSTPMYRYQTTLDILGVVGIIMNIAATVALIQYGKNISSPMSMALAGTIFGSVFNTGKLFMSPHQQNRIGITAAEASIAVVLFVGLVLVIVVDNSGKESQADKAWKMGSIAAVGTACFILRIVPGAKNAEVEAEGRAALAAAAARHRLERANNALDVGGVKVDENPPRLSFTPRDYLAPTISTVAPSAPVRADTPAPMANQN